MELFCSLINSSRPGVRWEEGYRKHILWPFFAWNVLTPRSSRRNLNILQQTVLSLRIAGVKECHRMAKLLVLPPDLIAIVIKQLEETFSAITCDGSVTQKGYELLEGEAVVYEDQKNGWVFQDTYTGQLLHRFVPQEDISYLEYKLAQNGTICRIEEGTVGKRKPISALLIPKGDSHPHPPSPRDILKAEQTHQILKEHWNDFLQDNPEMAVESEVTTAANIDQVTLIPREEKVIYLQTFAYLPEDQIGSDKWCVLDPFGLGPSEDLRNRLLKIESPPVRKMIAELKPENYQTEEIIELGDENGTAIAEEALDEVEHQFRTDDEEIDYLNPAIRDRLLLAWTDLLRLEKSSPADTLREIDSVYGRIRQAIELLMGEFARAFHPGDAWKKLFASEYPLRRDACEEIIKKCACVCGFDQAVPPEILNAKPRDIKNFCKRLEVWKLTIQPAVFLLHAVDQSGHPVRELGRAHPKWLIDFNNIVRRCGKSVHQKDPDQTIENARADTQKATELCLKLLTIVNKKIALTA